jgi:hypothetical protein
MRHLILSDGRIIQASDMVAEHLLKKKGARELTLQPINTPTIYADQTGGSTGTGELPKPKRSRKPGGSEGKVSGELGKQQGAKRQARKD